MGIESLSWEEIDALQEMGYIGEITTEGDPFLDARVAMAEAGLGGFGVRGRAPKAPVGIVLSTTTLPPAVAPALIPEPTSYLIPLLAGVAIVGSGVWWFYRRKR